VHKINIRDIVISGRFPDEFPAQDPQAWTKQDLITLEEATEVCMVEVTTEFHW
jgi:hypothetical protein